MSFLFDSIQWASLILVPILCLRIYSRYSRFQFSTGAYTGNYYTQWLYIYAYILYGWPQRFWLFKTITCISTFIIRTKNSLQTQLLNCITVAVAVISRSFGSFLSRNSKSSCIPSLSIDAFLHAVSVFFFYYYAIVRIVFCYTASIWLFYNTTLLPKVTFFLQHRKYDFQVHHFVLLAFSLQLRVKCTYSFRHRNLRVTLSGLK